MVHPKKHVLTGVFEHTGSVTRRFSRQKTPCWSRSLCSRWFFLYRRCKTISLKSVEIPWKNLHQVSASSTLVMSSTGYRPCRIGITIVLFLHRSVPESNKKRRLDPSWMCFHTLCKYVQASSQPRQLFLAHATLWFAHFDHHCEGKWLLFFTTFSKIESTLPFLRKCS